MFMRTLFTGLAAVVALAVAMPVFAQTEQAPPAPPVPTAKPKPGTTAYCQTLKSASSRNACLKRVQAQAAPKKAPTKATAHKTKKPPSATNPPPAAMAPASTSAYSCAVHQGRWAIPCLAATSRRSMLPFSTARAAAGCVIVTFAVVVQPPASVTVTMYVPAARPVAVWAV